MSACRCYGYSRYRVVYDSIAGPIVEDYSSEARASKIARATGGYIIADNGDGKWSQPWRPAIMPR